MNIYEMPLIEFKKIDVADIISTSPDDKNLNGFDGDDQGLFSSSSLLDL